MDVREQLQAFTAQIVALGHATLEYHRRGEALPDALAELAASLAELEDRLSAPAGDGMETSEMAPNAADEIDVAFAEPATPDEMPADKPDFTAMSPIEADSWLEPLDASDGDIFLAIHDEPGEPNEVLLVLDVEEEAGSGPTLPGESPGALPPLVIDPVTDLLADDESSPAPQQAPVAATGDVVLQATSELRFCTNCGADLRPGRRFCYRCGASVAEMVAEASSEPRATAPPPAEALRATRTPLPPPGLPPEEWPTMIGDLSRPELRPDAAPAVASRYCANCGLGLAADVTVCPECGSRNIA